MMILFFRHYENKLHHNENKALCAKIAFGIKYFMRISAILAAMLHF